MDNRTFAEAAQKLINYQYHFLSIEVTYPSIEGGMKTSLMPDAFAKFDPNVIEHFFRKWCHFQGEDAHGSFIRLFAELSDNNRYTLLCAINESTNHGHFRSCIPD
ncbi:MAG: hypothetical protein MJZ30_11450 [Paludibacteraceae bacterium]|nr:hypothetical protein [Paludibacteraceae bacterium]